MPLVVIPDLTVTPKPALADVRVAEQALVAAIGGVHEGVRHPGALDGDNIAAAAGFLNAQKAEALARVALATGRSTALDAAFGDPHLPSDAGPKALVVAPFDVQCDSVQLWHTNAAALTGIVDVYLGAEKLTGLLLPANGVAQGEVAEFAFPFTLRAGSVLDFRWLDADKLAKTVAGAAPSAYARLFVTIFGAAPHIAV
jgi:hypothetical protein